MLARLYDPGMFQARGIALVLVVPRTSPLLLTGSSGQFSVALPKKNPPQKGKSVKSVGNSKTVSAPAVRAKQVRSSVPNNAKQITVVHRELAATLSFSGVPGFVVHQACKSVPGLDLNPTSLLFPWLRGVAPHYEMYRFRKVKFGLLSSCPTSYSGRAYMAVDYDYDDPTPPDKMSLMSSMTAIEGPVWNSLELTADCSAMHSDMPWKYTSVNGRRDPEPRTVYGGFLVVGVDRPIQEESMTFDLWVEYTVDLKAPQMERDQVYLNSTDFRGFESELLPAGQAGPLRVAELPPECPVKRVLPGIGPTPQLRFARPSTSLTLEAPEAYDLAQEMGGVLNMACGRWVATETPLQAVPANPNMALEVFDSVGNYLGEVATNSDVNRPGQGQFSMYPPEASIPGTPYFMNFGVVLDRLRALYPAARYVAPVLLAGLQLALGKYRMYGMYA